MFAKPKPIALTRLHFSSLALLGVGLVMAASAGKVVGQPLPAATALKIQQVAGKAGDSVLPGAGASVSAQAVSEPALATPVASSSSLAGKSPTIAALNTAQKMEIDAEVRRRIGKALSAATPAAPVAAAPAQATAPLPVISRPPVVKVAKRAPDITKTVVAIYGPAGQEVADVRMPDGSIVTAKRGSSVEGFEVLRVSPQSVDLSAVVSSGGPSKASVSAPTATVRVAVGGTFK